MNLAGRVLLGAAVSYSGCADQKIGDQRLPVNTAAESTRPKPSSTRSRVTSVNSYQLKRNAKVHSGRADRSSAVLWLWAVVHCGTADRRGVVLWLWVIVQSGTADRSSAVLLLCSIVHSGTADRSSAVLWLGAVVHCGTADGISASLWLWAIV
jgi:hypothetical protein